MIYIKLIYNNFQRKVRKKIYFVTKWCHKRLSMSLGFSEHILNMQITRKEIYNNLLNPLNIYRITNICIRIRWFSWNKKFSRNCFILTTPEFLNI